MNMSSGEQQDEPEWYCPTCKNINCGHKERCLRCKQLCPPSVIPPPLPEEVPARVERVSDTCIRPSGERCVSSPPIIDNIIPVDNIISQIVSSYSSLSSSGGKQYVCQKCEATFSDRNLLYKHKKMNHSNPSDRVKCPKCRKTYYKKSRKSYVKHFVKDHNMSVEEVKEFENGLYQQQEQESNDGEQTEVEVEEEQLPVLEPEPESRFTIYVRMKTTTGTITKSYHTKSIADILTRFKRRYTVEGSLYKDNQDLSGFSTIDEANVENGQTIDFKHSHSAYVI